MTVEDCWKNDNFDRDLNPRNQKTWKKHEKRLNGPDWASNFFMLFFVCFWISGVQILVKIVIFSTVFNSHGTYGKNFSINHTLGCTRCLQAESGGNRSKLYFCILLFSEKFEILNFFKTPSFDFDDIFTECCPHV